MSATIWLAVGAGGALGAMARYGVAVWLAPDLARGGIPWATFLVNVIGTALLAALVATTLAGRGLTPGWKMFLGTGFSGALTTFSTFAVEAGLLAKHGHLGTAAAYVGLNLVACLAIAALVLLSVGVERL